LIAKYLSSRTILDAAVIGSDNRLSRQTADCPTEPSFSPLTQAKLETLATGHVACARIFRVALLPTRRVNRSDLSPNGSLQGSFRFAGVPGSVRTIPNCTIDRRNA
jgi:hypothetical protein